MYDDDFNGVWVKLSLPNSECFYIAVYYRPSWTDISNFNSNLENFPDRYGKFNGMIFGDLNLNIC